MRRDLKQVRNRFTILFGKSIYQNGSQLPLIDQRKSFFFFFFFYGGIRVLVSRLILSCGIITLQNRNFSHYFPVVPFFHIKIFFSRSWSRVSYVFFIVRVGIKRSRNIYIYIFASTHEIKAQRCDLFCFARIVSHVLKKSTYILSWGIPVVYVTMK